MIRNEESGAVPAAVISVRFLQPLPLFRLLGMGRRQKFEKARRPAITRYNIQSFREKKLGVAKKYQKKVISRGFCVL